MNDPETISVIRDVLAYNAVFPGLPGELVERMRRVVFRASETDVAIRANPDLRGRRAYEASLAAAPLYQDGTPRKTWDQLGDVERWSWERQVTTKSSGTNADPCRAPLCDCSMGATERCSRPGGAADPARETIGTGGGE